MKAPRPGLLDVNVLIALFDADHVHHDIAHDWFAEHRRRRWATCPVTENGFLRILTHPRSPVDENRPTIVASLKRLCESRDHVFWGDTVSMRDETLFDPSIVITHRQLTDIYLLGLAVRMKGRLVTFDGRIPLPAVKGATTESVVVLSS